MNRDKRLIYVILANEVNYILCSFCKFADFVACGEPECKHRLVDRLEDNWNWNCGREPGDDCWGFRPMYDVPTVTDIVGIILANSWEVAGWHKNEEGQLVVTGSKDFW